MNLVSLDPEVPKINNISNRDVVDVVKEERKEEDTSKGLTGDNLRSFQRQCLELACV